MSVRKAALIYNILRSTLHNRLNGIENRVETRAKSFKLTEIEESSLKNWIVSMDIRGMVPRPKTVQEMANLLLATRGTTPTQTIGKNWVSNYVKRHPKLDTRFSRRYNYERVKPEDLKSLQDGLI